MNVESFFTTDEILSALRFGATVQKMKWNKTCLIFPDQDRYDAWVNDQKQRHPHLWADLFSVGQKVQ